MLGFANFLRAKNIQGAPARIPETERGTPPCSLLRLPAGKNRKGERRGVAGLLPGKFSGGGCQPSDNKAPRRWSSGGGTEARRTVDALTRSLTYGGLSEDVVRECGYGGAARSLPADPTRLTGVGRSGEGSFPVRGRAGLGWAGLGWAGQESSVQPCMGNAKGNAKDIVNSRLQRALQQYCQSACPRTIAHLRYYSIQ